MARFATTEIYPLNRNMFGNSNFIPLAATNRKECEIEIDEPSCSTSSVRKVTSAFTTGLHVNISTIKLLISSNITQN